MVCYLDNSSHVFMLIFLKKKSSRRFFIWRQSPIEPTVQTLLTWEKIKILTYNKRLISCFLSEKTKKNYQISWQWFFFSGLLDRGNGPSQRLCCMVVRQQTANNMDGVCVKTIEKLYTGDGCLGSLFPPMWCLRKKYVRTLLTWMPEG